MPRKSANSPAVTKPAPPSRRIQVRRSGIHGRGVFALRAIEPGEVIIQYKGERISWEEAELRHELQTDDPYHTFLFQLEGDLVIDGGVQGNSARWINHSCEPNCEAQEDDHQRIFIVALHPIEPGDELFFDYALELTEKPSQAMRKAYACHCGSSNCRGSMLAPRRKRKSTSKATTLP